jgi:hypothetical protein
MSQSAELRGVWLLPRRDSHPLNTSAFSGRTVDGQLELSALQNWHLSGLGAVEDAAGVDAGLAIRIRLAASVVHQVTDFDEVARKGQPPPVGGSVWPPWTLPLPLPPPHFMIDGTIGRRSSRGVITPVAEVTALRSLSLG